MYSPPATASGTKYDRTSSTHSNTTNSHSLPSSHDQQPPPHNKLPSLPPFPSLVSSLSEGRPPQDYPLNSSSSKQTASASPSSSHRESSSLPPPPIFYPNHHNQHHHHLAPPSSQQYHHHHHHSEREQRRPSENDSATRSSWEPPSDRLLDPRIRTDNTSTSSSAEDRKPNLPLSSSRGSSIPFRSSSNLPFINHNMSGQQVEWESSIRTGSSASNSEAPLSPSHSNAKRRRLSAAHDIVHGSASAEELHDDDDQHSNHQIDELSPNIGGGGGHSSHLHSHNNSSNTIIMMNESASPPGGAGGGDRDTGNNSDEKGANGRTLKQTKRAAQNRAAQQAFRKRKEERIRELEEKEKVLNSLVARENEIVRREKILAERERLASNSNSNNATFSSSGLPQNGSSESAVGRGGPSGAATSSGTTSTTNDWDRAFASAPVASPVQHIAERLESSNRTNDLLKLENDNLNKSLMDKIALVESLRRSLEDLGAENRNLRDALGRSSAASSSSLQESSRHPHQQHSQQQQYSQQHNTSQGQQSQQPQQHSRASS